MKQLALFLVSNNLSFEFIHQTNSLIWHKDNGMGKGDGKYFFEFREDGSIYYIINNDDRHTWVELENVDAVQEFIISIENN